jgi:hypothetical protein
MKAKKHLEWAQTYIKTRKSVIKDMFDQLEQIAPEYLQEGCSNEEINQI